MEEMSIKGDLSRQGSLRTPLSLKTSFSGKASPRGSPALRRLGSSRTPRRESRGGPGRLPWVGNNKVVFWLLLITLWAYIGFHVQSQWAHHNKEELAGYRRESESESEEKGENAAEVDGKTMPPGKERVLVEGKKVSDSNIGVNLARKGRQVASHANAAPKKKKGRRLRRALAKTKDPADGGQNEDMDEVIIPQTNASYGLIVGPFRKEEDRVLDWSPEKRRGTCNRKGDFSRLVWSRRFMLIFPELSLTGAALSMMELASEILSCGGSVSAIVLSRKGGLMEELVRRGIKVLQDRDKPSFKMAQKVDLIIAGSAVCSSWIEPYLDNFPAGSGQIVWWIIENRREDFDKSKHLLHRVKMLTFLSESQSKQWLSWCEEEKISFYLQPLVVPLSVNDDLAFVAGIQCSLNTPAASVEKMLEKRELLRSVVRQQMGLGANDMLVMSLSSINPAKGQSYLLEAARLVAEHIVITKDSKSYEFLEGVKPTGIAELNQTITTVVANQTEKLADGILKNNSTRKNTKKKRRKRRVKNVTERDEQRRKLLSKAEDRQKEILKVLTGSVGSKSNKARYVKSLLTFLSQHSSLSKTVLWTPATTRVAALYAAADVYVINAQGLGETFGRVTIEAMAFGLPVLGTDAGGTKEIIDHRVTGLLHPVGHEGTEVLAQHIQYLLNNPSVREKMGANGRQKVLAKYLKHHTYESFAKVFFKCMKPK